MLNLVMLVPSHTRGANGAPVGVPGPVPDLTVSWGLGPLQEPLLRLQPAEAPAAEGRSVLL